MTLAIDESEQGTSQSDQNAESSNVEDENLALESIENNSPSNENNVSFIQRN